MEHVYVKQLVNIDDIMLFTMVDWMYQWWGKKEGYSKEEIICYMRHSINQDRLPKTYGLFLDDQLIGMYQFTYNDLDIRPDLYPWLANVYIDERYRGLGYGDVLLSTVQNHAKDSQLVELYLYTTHTNLYERYGFQKISQIDTYKKIPRVQSLYHIKL